MLLNFPMDERLNDRPQEFLGDDIHDLRAHLFQNRWTTASTSAGSGDDRRAA